MRLDLRKTNVVGQRASWIDAPQLAVLRHCRVVKAIRSLCSRRVVLVGGLLLLITGQTATCAAADPPTPAHEYEIKAAFIYNFTKFIEWPAQTFPDAQAPFVIGVLGDSPCAAALEQLVRDRKVNGRAIAVRQIDSAQQLASVHIVFVGSSQEARFRVLMPGIGAAPILTIGETAAFASMGGIINFVRQDDKVRFDINQHSAEQAGLRISAQLLKLAGEVR